MGNQQSMASGQNKTILEGSDKQTLLKKLDIVAANYITDLHLDDYEKFKEQDKCNELVVLTADKFANNLKFLDIVYLKQRTEKGSDISSLDDKKTKAYASTKVLYGKKNKLVDADEKNSYKKRRLCNGIAKFYVKIAQIYAAVVKALNPQLKFKDKRGNTSTLPMNETSSLIMGKNERDQIFQTVEFSICEKMRQQLSSNSSLKVDEQKNISIKPEFCKITSQLKNEPGIIELEELFKDTYDYDTGEYHLPKDPESVKQYMAIYKKFIKIFTGKDYIGEETPSVLPLFSKIILTDFEVCKDVDYTEDRSKFIKPYKISDSVIIENKEPYVKNKLVSFYEDEYLLFVKYAKTLKNFLIKLNEDEVKVLSILNALFVFIEKDENVGDDIKEKKESVMIRPELTDEKLNQVAMDARKYIFDLYINCKEAQTELHSIYREILIIRNSIKTLKK